MLKKSPKDWTTIEAALPAYLKNVLAPSELTPADDDGRRIIFSSNPKAEILNAKFGIMLKLLKVIQTYIDSETFRLEIVSDPEFQQAWKVIVATFHGARYLGQELLPKEKKEIKSG